MAESYLSNGTSYIYFIQGVEGGPIKIGLSRSPSTRLESIQSHSPVRLVIRRQVAVHQSKASVLERNLHRHFDSARLHGEWFRPVPELAKLAHALAE